MFKFNYFFNRSYIIYAEAIHGTRKQPATDKENERKIHVFLKDSRDRNGGSEKKWKQFMLSSIENKPAYCIGVYRVYIGFVLGV